MNKKHILGHKLYCIVLCLVGLLWLAGCSSPSSDFSDTPKKEPEELTFADSMELSYATQFTVECYEGGYRMLCVSDGTRILVVPQGKEAPLNIEDDIIVIKQPLSDIYLVASAVMDMFDQLEAIDTVSFDGLKSQDWYVDHAREAMEAGQIIYAGKYSKPDYELLLSRGCRLAIENRMILHTPQTREKLESLGIPVIVEYSSSESHPLGRMEWIKFWGVLLGKEEEAQKLFESQLAMMQPVGEAERTNQSIAFFFVTTNGLIQVRNSSDYIPKIIELAGGEYAFSDLEDLETSKSTINIQVEEFYQDAKDADYLIYNSSIDGGVDNMEQLLEKCPIIADFKAVKEHQVWCTTNDFYQQSMSLGYMKEDIQKMLKGQDFDAMRYLFRLE